MHWRRIDGRWPASHGLSPSNFGSGTRRLLLLVRFDSLYAHITGRILDGSLSTYPGWGLDLSGARPGVAEAYKFADSREALGHPARRSLNKPTSGGHNSQPNATISISANLGELCEFNAM